MQWSTDPDHSPVHVQMHGQMHVHARWSRGYSRDDRFTESSCLFDGPAPSRVPRDRERRRRYRRGSAGGGASGTAARLGAGAGESGSWGGVGEDGRRAPPAPMRKAGGEGRGGGR
ncbi:hypothetical protein GCM10010384_30040 [Streptomyces djakartensis]|uniref:Uncharacterized protein n=1 Tax=Streptomyces djakartensis TaxID=68193 RepID=A0ABQ2ZQ34_9ACTN|nr:hypothetical protein GCM10010384_30040 [Streptomyces djakartensis]